MEVDEAVGLDDEVVVGIAGSEISSRNRHHDKKNPKSFDCRSLIFSDQSPASGSPSNKLKLPELDTL